MTFRNRHGTNELEAALRCEHEAPRELVDGIVAKISARPARSRARLGLAGALAAAALAALASTGGFSYAKSTIVHVVRVFEHATSSKPRHTQAVAVPQQHTSAADQYTPSQNEQQANSQWQDNQNSMQQHLAAHKKHPACGPVCKKRQDAAIKYIEQKQKEQRAALANYPPDVVNDPTIVGLLDSFSRAIVQLDQAHDKLLAACKPANGCSVVGLLDKQAHEKSKLVRLQTEALAQMLDAVSKAHGH